MADFKPFGAAVNKKLLQQQQLAACIKALEGTA